MFAAAPSPKPRPEHHNYYCGSCGCKYFNKPGGTRPGVDHNCMACGSSRIIRYEWATD